MAEYSGGITYAEAEDKDNKVTIILQGTTYLSRGLLEYFATPTWMTTWRIYDNYSKLLWQGNRYHSIMPFNTSDSATDSVEVTLDKQAIYNVQLLAKLSSDPQKLVDEKRVDIAQPPVVTPPPVPPSPSTPPVTPSLPDEPVVTPPGGITPTMPTWGWIAVAGVALLVLAPKGKK